MKTKKQNKIKKQGIKNKKQKTAAASAHLAQQLAVLEDRHRACRDFRLG